MSLTQQTRNSFHLVLKILGGVVLVAMLAVGFVGYLTPGMRINWETIATMCGF